jgi:hypothetical protein
MRSVNDTINALRALENTLIDTQCEITDKERESIVRAIFKTIIEAPVEEPEAERKAANAGSKS